ncbi:unnamed protein product [Discula destructiva]
MPGRQSHGRSLMGKTQPFGKKGRGNNQKSKSKAQAHAQDAYAIAAKQIEPERITRRGRDLELAPERQSRGGKHSREEDDDDDEDDEEEDERPQKKRQRQDSDEDIDGSDADGGSDSDGNEWHIGVNGDDDDSELDSDEAFGDSDDDKFEGYTFRGSRTQKKADVSDDEDGDDGASLGSNAIDLADALDQSSDEDEDDEGSAGDTESGSEDEAGPDSESDDDEDVDPSKLGELHNLIKDYANNADADTDDGPSSKQIISLDDLGLSGVKDPLIKKALKLMKKEEKADAKTGASKKLDVPLPRRQQSQLLRAAAYEKTNETLDRWNETVKHNRRADHLVFPLAQNAHDAGLDNQELVPLTKKSAGTELERTIMAIMDESGLGPSTKSKEQQESKADANGEEPTISRSELKELWAQRRKDRELQSREQTRAKRIKKIKSKTYRRVHRKERLGDEANQLEVMRANGEINSDEEREAAHRRRALERVGAKHKESKWAKMGSKVGRAVWDDDYRAGLTDMARRNEELRRRVEGKAHNGSDNEEDSDGASALGDEDGTDRLLRELDAADEAEDDDDHPHSGLMSLKFMQRAEAQRKKDNDELVAEIRRELESGSEQEEDDTEVQVGRMAFGMGQDKKAAKLAKRSSTVSSGAANNGAKDKTLASLTHLTPGSADQSVSTGKSAGSEPKDGRKAVHDAELTQFELDFTGLEGLVSKPASKQKAATEKYNGPPKAAEANDDDSSDEDIHLPLAIRDRELVDRAFAGEDVVAEFEEEKEAIMSEDDEKVIKTTMPGWGSWAGEGMSKRAAKRNKGKVTTTKKDGVKKKDRQDARLSKVIINEKTNRKTGKYLATQLPHPFESRQQYERSLRLPVGPEWMTKESFQQATKPRVIVKQGIIAPMAKPTI